MNTLSKRQKINRLLEIALLQLSNHNVTSAALMVEAAQKANNAGGIMAELRELTEQKIIEIKERKANHA